jgi:arginase
MAMLHDRGLIFHFDTVEINRFLNKRGHTATLLVNLAASLLGRRVMNRLTWSF